MARRRVLQSVGIALLGLLVLLAAANIAGFAPIPGGPLGDLRMPSSDEGFEAITVATGHPIYTAALLENGWPLPVTILSVTAIPAGQSPAVTFVGAKPYSDTNDDAVLGLQADLPAAWQTFEPISGTTVPPRGDSQRAGVAILMRFEPVTAGDNAIRGVVVDYMVGPFRFRSSAFSAIANAILICAPNPADTQFPEHCPISP